jgi:hypothetical protein
VTCGASCRLQGLPFLKGLGGRRTAGRSFGTALRHFHPLSSLDCPGAPGLSPKSGSGARGSWARPSRCTAVRARTRKTTPRAVCVLRSDNRCSSTTDCPTVKSGRKPAALLYTTDVWRKRFVNFATWGIASGSSTAPADGEPAAARGEWWREWAPDTFDVNDFVTRTT